MFMLLKAHACEHALWCVTRYTDAASHKHEGARVQVTARTEGGGRFTPAVFHFRKAENILTPASVGAVGSSAEGGYPSMKLSSPDGSGEHAAAYEYQEHPSVNKKRQPLPRH